MGFYLLYSSASQRDTLSSCGLVSVFILAHDLTRRWLDESLSIPVND